MSREKVITVFICICFIAVAGVVYLNNSKASTNQSTLTDIEGGSSEISAKGNAFTQGPVNTSYTTATQSKSNMSATASDKGSDKANQSDSEIQVCKVFICGAVKKPGVYSFDGDARLCDAIDMAGGFKKTASKDSLNLARKLEDGEQIKIPTLRQAKKASRVSDDSQDSVASKNISNDREVTSDNVKTSSEFQSGKININKATKEELMTLTGVGESRADAIISYRDENGGFKKIEDIMNITGIKDGVFNNIKDSITI